MGLGIPLLVVAVGGIFLAQAVRGRLAPSAGRRPPQRDRLGVKHRYG